MATERTREPWFRVYERDVLGEAGAPWPTKPRRPVVIPAPPPPAPVLPPEPVTPPVPPHGWVYAAMQMLVGWVRR